MIQAVKPATATAAWETGTWRWPAGSSRLAAGSKAQIVETVDVGGEPDSLPAPAADSPGPSWVVPSPGTGRWITVLSPPATNSSLPTVTARAPAKGSGRWPMTAAVCRAGFTTWITSTGAPARRPVIA